MHNMTADRSLAGLVMTARRPATPWLLQPDRGSTYRLLGLLVVWPLPVHSELLWFAPQGFYLVLSWRGRCRSLVLTCTSWGWAGRRSGTPTPLAHQRRPWLAKNPARQQGAAPGTPHSTWPLLQRQQRRLGRCHPPSPTQCHTYSRPTTGEWQPANGFHTRKLCPCGCPATYPTRL